MKSQHSLSQLFAVFEVKRSGYYAWLKAPDSQREATDAVLLVKVRAVYEDHQGRYGAPRIQDALAKQGDSHGCKRIARLMKEAGMQGRCSRRFVPCTTDSNHDHPIAPNLLAERAAPTGPNQTWVTDLTFESRLDKQNWAVIDHHVTEVTPKHAVLVHDIIPNSISRVSAAPHRSR